MTCLAFSGPLRGWLLAQHGRGRRTGCWALGWGAGAHHRPGHRGLRGSAPGYGDGLGRPSRARPGPARVRDPLHPAPRTAAGGAGPLGGANPPGNSGHSRAGPAAAREAGGAGPGRRSRRAARHGRGRRCRCEAAGWARGPTGRGRARGPVGARALHRPGSQGRGAGGPAGRVRVRGEARRDAASGRPGPPFPAAPVSVSLRPGPEAPRASGARSGAAATLREARARGTPGRGSVGRGLTPQEGASARRVVAGGGQTRAPSGNPAPSPTAATEKGCLQKRRRVCYPVTFGERGGTAHITPLPGARGAALFPGTHGHAWPGEPRGGRGPRGCGRGAGPKPHSSPGPAPAPAFLGGGRGTGFEFC